jgi:zinc-ribbon domain
VYCPRCGTPNESGDRFCSSCGAQLGTAEAAQRPSWRDRLSQLIGTTRKARLLTAATAVALVVAVVAFIALDPADDDTIPRDGYTVAADEMCIAAKRQIVFAERRLLREGDTRDVAEALLPIVAQWRSDFAALVVPEDRVEEARSLDRALRGVEFEIGGLARFADGGNRRQTLAQAKAADRAATRVEEAIAALGLSRCGRRTIGLTPE